MPRAWIRKCCQILTVVVLCCEAVAAEPVALPAKWTQADCLACAVDAAELRARYDGARWKDLESGKVLSAEVTDGSSNGSALRETEALGIITHEPARVWEVLVDFESRPRFLPNLEEIHITKIDGDRIWLQQRLEVFWTDIEYALTGRIDPEHGIVSFELDTTQPHDIADTHGSWRIYPLKERHETLLVYRTAVDTGRPVPEMIENLLIRRSLPKTIEGVRSEVDRRAAHKSSP
jgi:ribosome-associated toxin RatA of RatAB toxin-antitoxin module